ncbi:cryptochrome/photolyase family protein [Acanthopleuribacter pedis]|uniref:Cryptochrome/photolyase family protein n=1 Tax=Acanthopleuribacter pedis TaxID=442870 RepID=A0A8J7U4C8_9BACT|nr:cryptochrome/photolyase family protein [Acanthopleuribacter pedis]MBO1319288.1 cryptochrome/photolyase family protein [Acanthopleuribacter pedis]
MDVTLIFPHQLFKEHPAVALNRPCWMVEDSLYFYDQRHPVRFHKQKLVLHRASMKAFADQLKRKRYRVHYADFPTYPRLKPLLGHLQSEGVRCVHVVDPTDFLLEKRLKRFTADLGLRIQWYESPNFLTPRRQYESFLYKRKRYSMAEFYAWQRKRLNILLDPDEKPLGGKWSFDTENRKKLPRGHRPPDIGTIPNTKYVNEAKAYVAQHFAAHPGSLEGFNYPINHDQARTAFSYFLRTRFRLFGPYEDALSVQHAFIYHAVLTPSLNIGLLSPSEIIERTMAYAEDHQIALPSLEGFLRQIIGWREFMRAMYEVEGVKQRNGNFFGHTQQLPDSFWQGTTGIQPIDHVVKKVDTHAYAHHIERLMVLGNFMLLCEIEPHAVYRWFMGGFIDSYDWVMVPNVYAMSQYADGGGMTTKPYFSSANYLRKMSDYPSGPWEEVWDGLFWRFIARHRDFFAKNHRLSMMVRQYEKMDTAKRNKHFHAADQFLGRFFG